MGRFRYGYQLVLRLLTVCVLVAEGLRHKAREIWIVLQCRWAVWCSCVVFYVTVGCL